jgi:hypothetical protein
MKYILTLFIALILALPGTAQRGKDARGYFKNFQSESRKIGRKNYIYLEAIVKGSDERRVVRYREMVVEQLKDSKRVIGRVGDFGDDDVLKREYEAGLDMYIKAFEDQFRVSDSLNPYKFKSYDDLMAYHTQLEKAEQTMIDAAFKIKKAEEYFAKQYQVDARVDEQMEEQYRMLDEVTLYARDMTEIFFRVDAQAQAFIGAAQRNNMDSLPLIVKNMRIAINESQEQLMNYTDEPEDANLKRDIEYYLEDIKLDLNETLVPVSEALGNAYLEEDEFRDAQDELERFVDRNTDYREDFFTSRADLIEEYLPEK